VKIDRVLISSEDLDAKLAEMGRAISTDYEAKNLLMVGVLKGAFMVMADLARHIDIPVEFDFMAVSSYGGTTKSSGVVRILKDLDEQISGRHVLIVEDIIDSGLTLHYLMRNLRVRNPASLALAALLIKDGIDRPPLDIAYEGFHIPNEFVVGYGLDYEEKLRNLPYIGVMTEDNAGSAASAAE
jgi:hypoxanthine phosphoribosyltransferase